MKQGHILHKDLNELIGSLAHGDFSRPATPAVVCQAGAKSPGGLPQPAEIAQDKA